MAQSRQQFPELVPGNPGARDGPTTDPEVYLGIDFEFVPIFGIEVTPGFVLNLKDFWASGVFSAPGYASGGNVGLAGVIGYAHRGVEGTTVNMDLT